MMTRTRSAYVGSLALLILLFLLPRVGSAQEAKKFYTLQESVAEAISNSWDIRQIEQRIYQAEYLKKQARADFLPRLGMTYTALYSDEPEAFPVPGGAAGPFVTSKDYYEWQGTLTQPIFTGFSLLSSYELAKLGIDQAQIQLEQAGLELALRVKEGYFDILGADKTVEVGQKDVEARESAYKVASSFYKVGMIPINELLQAEVELANSKQALVRAEIAARTARAAFNTILARPVNEPFDIQDILTYKPSGGDYESFVKEALANRPEIRAVENRLLQADQQIRLAKSKYYPEIAFNYDYIKDGDSFDVSGFPGDEDTGRWEATAVATWTFWQWGKTYYSMKEQESAKKELFQAKWALDDQIRLEVKEAMLALEREEKNIPTTQKAVEQGEENLRVSSERYKAQVTTITEVLDAQTRLSQARLNYYRALYDHNLARARLEKAIGTY
ncbi:MAG: TolC family protein [Deltaproteobacteria bacterium]